MSKTIQCPSCHEEINEEELLKSNKVCPFCNYHFRLKSQERIDLICDEGSFKEVFTNIKTSNPLNMEGYEKKLEQQREKSSLEEAVIAGECKIKGEDALLCVMSFDFMGGSMGALVGEKITETMLQGALTDTPVIICTASGGARMQEGIFSLMQMAKTSSAVSLMNKCGVPLFIVLTHPTTGGVTASFAMLGDVILSESGALIGFAGPRVIQGTIGEKLPDGFQTSEFQKEHGFVDAIVDRKDLATTLNYLIRTHKG
jgi:acetyl-CoA carboxylase carboxyl transferase subunit beta